MQTSDIIYGQHHVPNWNWRMEPGRHPGFTLWGTWGGSGNLSLGATHYPLGIGDVFFINYRKTVDGRQEPAAPLHVRFVDFALADPSIAAAWPEHRHFASLRFLSDLFDRLQAAQQAGAEIKKRLWLDAILAEYLAAESPLQNSPHAERIDALCREFQRHPERPYQVERLAGDFYCATDHFIRLFKQAKGITPYAYLQNVRLETAQILLRNSNNNITEIATAVGFPTIYVFSRFFRRKTGLTPSAFRAGAAPII